MTIPRFVDDVDTVTVKGGWGESNELLRTVTELGLSRNEPLVKGITPREFISEFLVKTLEETTESRFSLSVTVSGLTNSEEVEYRYDLPSVGQSDCDAYPFSVIPVAIPTGIPMAIGAGFLAMGNVTGTGVLPPEAAFDAGDFLTQSQEYLDIRESVHPSD